MQRRLLRKPVKRLKDCRSGGKNSFVTHTVHHADDKAAGYISSATEDIDATGIKERLSLVN